MGASKTDDPKSPGESCKHFPICRIDPLKSPGDFLCFEHFRSVCRGWPRGTPGGPVFFPMDVALFASDVDQLSQLLGELGEAQLRERDVGCLSKGKGSEKKQQKRGGLFFWDLMTFYGCNTDDEPPSSPYLRP